MENPGSILAFTYTSEGAPGAEEQPRQVRGTKPRDGAPSPAPIVGGIAPQFTEAQAANGRTAYNATCAVCHGSTLKNGAYGTPLAGEYFKGKWSHRSVRALFDRVRTTMPPSQPGSLAAGTYTDIVAYILQVNGSKAGATPLKATGEGLDRMAIE